MKMTTHLQQSAKARPILFSGPMVRAILEGHKTQTRRVIKPQPDDGLKYSGFVTDSTHRANVGTHAWLDRHPCPSKIVHVRCPYGQPGDRLRVREDAWMWCQKVPNGTTARGNHKFKYEPLRSAPVHYCADHPQKPAVEVVSPSTDHPWAWRKKLGRFMPGWASRITLEVVNMRVERLSEIVPHEIFAEGCPYHVKAYPSVVDLEKWYAGLWNSINGPGSWDANPWVWVVEFKRL